MERSILRALHTPVLALFILLIPTFSGCIDLPGQSPLGDAPWLHEGEQATYDFETNLPGADRQEILGVSYRVGGQITTRDAFGRAVDAHLIELFVGGQTSAYLEYDARAGRLAATGHWEVAPPKVQGFPHHGPLWACFPGLENNATIGNDAIRFMFLPLFCLAPNLAAGDLDAATGLPEPFHVAAGAAPRTVVVDVPDASGTGDGHIIRFELEWHGQSNLPSRYTVSTLSDADATPTRIGSGTRTAHQAGTGPGVPWPEPGHAAATALQIDTRAATDVPPLGATTLIPFPLADAHDAATTDPRIQRYLDAHPEASLFHMTYNTLQTEGVTAAEKQQWRLRWTNPAGSGLYAEVERTATTNGNALAPSVGLVNERGERPLPAAEFPPLVPLALVESRIDGSVRLEDAPDGLIITFQRNPEPAHAGTDSAYTWYIRDAAHLTIGGANSVTFSATTGAMLSRAEWY